MPYASAAQRGFMHAQYPRIAARWDAEEKRRAPTAGAARSFPNLARGLVGISDRVLADHLALYARLCDELGALDLVQPARPWNAPQTLPQEVVQRLLVTPVRDLNLAIEDKLAELLLQLRSELTARGITWFPSFYLGEGDFWTADQAVSINLPWWLANDALWEMVNAGPGGPRYSEDDLMRVLRHEAGHALGYAFELWRQGAWKSAFGNFLAPYADTYTPDPASRDFVRNLHDSVAAPNAHYAQKHPDEDWAETFAVWLDPGSRWAEDYAEWPGALQKLRAVDLMLSKEGLAYGKTENTRVGRRVPYTALDYTVGDFLGQNDGPDPALGARRRLPEVYDGVVLHEAYFGGLTSGSDQTPRLGIIGAAAASFGSWEAWAADHRAAARAASGWVLTVWDRRDARVRNVLVADHSLGVPAGCDVLLALDMWEHAYAGDHGIRAADYVAAWWQNVDWGKVEGRLLVANPPPVETEVLLISGPPIEVS
jgi:hypothetical protein